MSERNRPRAIVVVIAASAALAASGAHAAPPTKGSLRGGSDGQLEYTVTIDSQHFGGGHETRKIRSGETDDYSWKSVPPSGAVPMDDACPRAASMPRDANGALVRQAQVRLAPVVDKKGVANVQMSFMGTAPAGTKRTVTVSGKKLVCPNALTVSQVKWVSIPVGGGAKTLAMSDGTKVTVAIER